MIIFALQKMTVSKGQNLVITTFQPHDTFSNKFKTMTKIKHNNKINGRKFINIYYCIN